MAPSQSRPFSIWARRLIRSDLAFAALVVAVGPAEAAARPPKTLYDQWMNATVECRGGAGDERSTYAACERRNVVDRKMKAAGWCSATPVRMARTWTGTVADANSPSASIRAAART